jgi:serpin B
MGYLKNLWRRVTSSPSTPEALGSDFATRLYAMLADNEAGKNLFLSPFSIQVALAMCSAGAKGETRRVMAELIGAPENVDEQNRNYAALLQSINGDGERPFQLLTANALWGQQGCRFKPDFQEAIADFYDGALHVVDFQAQPDEAARSINAWVSDKTRAKIRELVRRGSIMDARLVLTNAIYFKGRWQNEFQQDDTEDDDWYGPGGMSKVPTMHQTGGYEYCEGGTYQAVDLSYKGGRLAMLVVLPRKKDGLAALESQWAVESMYQQVTARLQHEAEVIVSLPRFKTETEFKLKPVLCALGIGLVFSDEADFSGMCEEDLMIAEVIHKACVEANEEGTEAAAATAVVMDLAAALPRRMPKPKVFKADHPFLFFIRDRRTNAVLFSGRLLDPT